MAAAIISAPGHRLQPGHRVPGLISRALAPSRPSNLQITTPQELAAFLNRGSETWSGVEVTEQTAMNVSAFFAGIRYVSEDIAKLPWPVYRSEADGDRVRAKDSPYWALLHDSPNGWMDSQQFRELGTAIALLRGDFVCLQGVPRRDTTRELLPLKPGHVVIEQLPDYGIVYHVRMSSGEVKDFPQRDVFHFRGFSFDGVHGVSILSVARQALGLALSIQKHGSGTFKNGAHPSGVFKHPGELSDRAYTRLKEDLDSLKGEGAGGALILEDGMDWTQIGMSNEDAQFLGSAQFSVTEFCRYIRIAPHKLFDLSHATFSNIEMQSIEYVQDTLYTWGRRWDLAAKRQVIGALRPEYAEINYEALLTPTTADRFAAYRIAAGRPWMTGNEIRRAENLPQMEDDESMDTAVLPLNLSTDPDGTKDTVEAGAAGAKP